MGWAIFIVFLVWCLLSMWGYHREKKAFNKGICPMCGTPIELWDKGHMDPNIWKCPYCSYTTITSWYVPAEDPNLL